MFACVRARLRQHRERDAAFGPLQDADGFFVGDALQGLAVDRHYLVPSLQSPIFCRRTLTNTNMWVLQKLDFLGVECVAG